MTLEADKGNSPSSSKESIVKSISSNAFYGASQGPLKRPRTAKNNGQSFFVTWQLFKRQALAFE
jgi:hypothetical protein